MIGVALVWSLQASATGAESAAYHFALAKVLAEEGAFSEAIEEFDRSIALAPDDAYARLEFAELLLRLGRILRAVEQVDMARALAPDSVEVVRTFAQVHLRNAEESTESLAAATEALEWIRVREPEDLQSMLSLGQIYLGSSRFAEATEVFREALSYQPGNLMAYSVLVDSLLREGRTVEAEAVLADALSADPGFSRARVGLADLQSKRGDHKAAAETLAAGAPEDLENPEIAQRLALELYRAGELEGALAAVEAALERRPDEFGALYLKSTILAALGELARAEEILSELTARNPENLELTLLLAGNLERQGRPSDAATVLAEAAGRAARGGDLSQARRIRLETAMVWARVGDWDEVLARTGAMLAAEPAAALDELVLLRAEALVRLERQDEALELLADHGHAASAGRLLARRAEILFDLDRDVEASAVMAELTSTGAEQDLLLAAEVYQRLERYAEAIPVLEEILESSPRSVQALFWMGASLERTGRKPEAVATFEDLLEIDGSFAPALNYLGYMWAEEGRNLEQALDMIQRAVALEPDNGAYVDSLGWTHFQLGQLEEAQGHLERAAALVGEDPVVFEHLGDLYLAIGRPDKAREVYERSLALEGENVETVRRKLAELADDD